MGLGHSIISEINSDSLKMNHPTPATLVQPMTGGDCLWYVIYRFLMAIYFLTTCLYCVIKGQMSKVDPLHHLHFPVLGYLVATLYSVLMAYCTVENYYSAYKKMSEVAPAKHRRSSSRRKKKTTFSVSLPKMPKIYVVTWVTYYIILYASLITLINYQTYLFAGRLLYVVPNSHKRVTSQILIHQVVFPVVFFDFCLSGIPVRLLHAYVMTIYACAYHLVLLFVTIALSRNVQRYRPIYDVADLQFDRITICCLYFVGFSFIIPVAVHIVYFCLFLLKSYLVELYFRTTRTTKGLNQPANDAAAMPDEKGGAGSPEWAPGQLRPSKIMPISEQEESEINSLNREQNPSNNSIALVDFK